MFKLTVVALLCAQAFARPYKGEIESHIVGGTRAQEGDYPFIVSIRQTTGFTFCGGAILSDRYIVTAAHCVAKQKSLKIGAGSIHLSSQKLFNVDKIMIHRMYSPTRNINDIALLRLKTALPLGRNIQTIRFPVTENLDGKNVTGLGWGETSEKGPVSEVLLYLRRPIIDNRACAQRLNTQIIDSQICLQGEKNFGMSFGDSGSPLLYKGSDGQNYIAGVVSWGIPCARGYPDVFTRVSNYTQWLKQNMV